MSNDFFVVYNTAQDAIDGIDPVDGSGASPPLPNTTVTVTTVVTEEVGNTFDIQTGDQLRFTVDNGVVQTIVIRDGDVTNNRATILEINNLLLDKLTGVTPEILTDPISKSQSIRLRTNTPGLLGAIEYSQVTVDRTRIDNFPTLFEETKTELLNQDQRTVIYEINPNEVIIELPAVVPSLARGLRGSLHLHRDSLLSILVERGSILSYVLPEGLFEDNTDNSYTITLPDNFVQLFEWDPETNYSITDRVVFEDNVYEATGTVAGDINNFVPNRTGAPWTLIPQGSLTFLSYNSDSRNLTVGTESIFDAQVLEITINDTPTSDSTIFYLRIEEDLAFLEDSDIWTGAFIFDPTGSNSNFTITGQSAIIVGDATVADSTSLTAGEVHPRIEVEPETNTLPDEPGFAVIGFGSGSQEAALIRYRGRASDAVIEIDPAFVFTNTQNSGTFINIVSNTSPFVVDRVGNAFPIYLTSSTSARETILEILRTLSAAGIIVNFVVLAPDYKYLIDNPYLTDDNSPSEGSTGQDEGYKYLIDNPTISSDGVPSV